MSSTKTFCSSPSCCIVQKASLCVWACGVLSGHLFCCSLRADQGCLSLGVPLALTRKPHSSAPCSSHQPCSRGMCWCYWRIWASFPSWDSVIINNNVVSLSDQTASLNLPLFKLAGRATTRTRQKICQVSWELWVVREPMGEAAWRFLHKALHSKLGKNPFVWLNVRILKSAWKKFFLKSCDRSVCVFTGIF